MISGRSSAEVEGVGLIADDDVLGAERLEAGLRADGFDGLPLVFGAGLGDPARERHAEVVAEAPGRGVRRGRGGRGGGRRSGSPQRRRPDSASESQRRWKLSGGRRSGSAAGEPFGSALLFQMEDVAEIDQRMAGHGEGELRLAGGGAGNDGDQQRAGVEHGGEGGEPALVVVLRAVVAENRVGDVGLEDLGGPAFPLGEQVDEGFLAAVEGVAAQELGGGGRRAGAGVEQGDVDFAVRRRRRRDGNVADDEGDQAEAGAGFEDDEGAGGEGAGSTSPRPRVKSVVPLT